MLDNTAKAMLVESMRKSLAKSVLNNKQLSESAVTESINYIAETATYEQLLNLSLNPLRESKYLPAYVLEGAAAILSSAMMTQRKVIGINAITEGAIRLQKKTGAVITESMLDAALEAAKGHGLHVVADCLKEAFKIADDEAKKALAEAAKPALSGRGAALMESVVSEGVANTARAVGKAVGKKLSGGRNVVKKGASKAHNVVKDKVSKGVSAAKEKGSSLFDKAWKNTEHKSAMKAAESKLDATNKRIARLTKKRSAIKGKKSPQAKSLDKQIENAKAKAAEHQNIMQHHSDAINRNRAITVGTGATAAGVGATALAWRKKKSDE